jgi:hypothetical protein
MASKIVTGYGRTPNEARLDAEFKAKAHEPDTSTDDAIELATTAAVGGFILFRWLYQLSMIFVVWTGFLFSRPVPTLIWTALSASVFFSLLYGIQYITDGSENLLIIILSLGVAWGGGGGIFLNLQSGTQALVLWENAFYRRLPGWMAAIVMTSISILVPLVTLYAIFWFVFVGMDDHAFTDLAAAKASFKWMVSGAPWIGYAMFAIWAVMLLVGLLNRRQSWLEIFRGEDSSHQD